MVREGMSDWKDFPKGLSVLVVDKDRLFLDTITSRLQLYHYNVTAFSEGDQALTALADNELRFHVALVEAVSSDSLDGYKILEASNGLPTIMMSQIMNMAIMMKCFSLGAVEVLQKPLSDEKLRNIWHHVVRKVFSDRDSLVPQSFKLVKETVECMLQEGTLQKKKNTTGLWDREAETKVEECAFMELTACKKSSAPSTPQIEQDGRTILQDEMLGESPRSTKSIESKNPEKELVKVKPEFNDNCHNDSRFDEMKSEALSRNPMRTMKTNFPIELSLEVDNHNKVPVGNVLGNNFPCSRKVPLDREKTETETGSSLISKISTSATSDFNAEPSECLEFRDTGSGNDEALLQTDLSKTEEESVNVEAATGEQSLEQEESKDDRMEMTDNSESDGKESKIATGKKKLKVDWTPDLHRRFVQAVERLGIDQAIPSRILEIMKVEGLTRHNVASHLQKYRSHRKHLPRETEAVWQPTCPKSWVTLDANYLFASHQGNMPIQSRHPILPSIQLQIPSHGQQTSPLHVWGHPTGDHYHMRMWQQRVQAMLNTPSTMQAPDGSMWQHLVTATDAWGHPAPVLGTPCYQQSGMTFFSGPVPALSQSIPSSALPGEDTVVLSNDGYSNIGVTPGATACVKLFDSYPPKDLLDEAISEALRNPYTPLPLGLKPPSMKSVIAELQRQGINISSSHASP